MESVGASATLAALKAEDIFLEGKKIIDSFLPKKKKKKMISEQTEMK